MQGSDAKVIENFNKDLRSIDTGSSGSIRTGDFSGYEQQIDLPKMLTSNVDISTSKKSLKTRIVESQTVLERKSTSCVVADSCSIHADSSTLNNNVSEEDDVRIPADQRDSVVETSVSHVLVKDVQSNDVFSRTVEQHCELSDNSMEKVDDATGVSFVTATAADLEDSSCSTKMVSTVLLTGVESVKSVSASHDVDNLQILDSSEKDHNLPKDHSCRCTMDHLPTVQPNGNESNRTASNEKITVDDFRESCLSSPQRRCRTCCNCNVVAAADENFHPVTSNISGARCKHGKCVNFVESCSGDTSNAIVDNRQHRCCHNHVYRKNNDSKDLCCCGQRSNLRQRRVTFRLPRSNFMHIAGSCVDSKMKSSNCCVHQVRANEKREDVTMKNEKSAEVEIKEKQQVFPRYILQFVNDLTNQDVAVFNDRTKDRSCSQCCDYVGTNRRIFCSEIVNKRRDILGGTCLKNNVENGNAEDCLSPVTKDEGINNRVDSEKDWILPPKRDVLASNDIIFPKETQRAMNVLLHGRKSWRSKKYNDSG